jgi:hypothetical protein
MTPYGSSAYGTAPYGASAGGSSGQALTWTITLRSSLGVELVLESAMAQSSLGWPIRLLSRDTGDVSAAITLSSVADSLAAPIRLVSRETGPISLGITLLGSVTAAAAGDSVIWQPTVTVNGVDLSARLYGEISIEREEDASAIA